MPGLLDMFGGGSNIYGDLLTDQQKQAMATRGLLAMAGAFADAGKPSLLPTGGLGYALGKGAAAFGESQDTAGLNALRATLVGQQGQKLKSEMEMREKLKGILPMLLGGDSGAGGAVPAAMTSPQGGGPVAPQGILPAAMAGPSPIAAPDMGGGLSAGGAAGLLSPFATGNAVAGGPSSIEGVLPEFASRINTMAQSMPPDIRAKFGIISGFRSPERQAEVNPGVTNSHHTAAGPGTGIAVDTVTDPDVINWINKNGRMYGVDYTLRHLPNEQNHLEMLGPDSQRISPNQMAAVVARYRNQSGGPSALSGPATASPDQLLGSVPAVAGMMPAGGPLAAPPAAVPAGGPLAAPGVGAAPMASPAPAASSNYAAGLNPRALAAAGVLSQLGGLPDVFKPLETLVYNSPQYKGQVKGAEAAAEDPFLRGRAEHQAAVDIKKAWQTPTDLQKGLVAAGIPLESQQASDIMQRAFPDSRPEAVRLAEAANLQGGNRDTTIAGAISGNAPTGEQKDYQAYVKDQQMRAKTPLSFNEWDLGRRKAAATLINTTEGFEAAQAKARFTMDTAAAKDVSEQAVAGRRLMPLLDEVVRLADKTPGGWAGPIAATTARAFSGLGIPVAETQSNAELLQSIGQRLIPIVREPGPTSEREMDNYLRVVPGLMQSQEGRVKVAEMFKSMVNRTNEIAKVYRDNVGAPDLYDKLAALDKPIFSADQRKAMEAVKPEAAGPGGAITTPYGTIREVR